MSYYYNGRTFDSAQAALEASIYDYVVVDEPHRAKWLAESFRGSEGAREDDLGRPRRRHRLLHFDANGAELFESDADGEPCYFTEPEIHAAFDAVAERLRRGVGRSEGELDLSEAMCIHGLIGRCEECQKAAVRLGVPGLRQVRRPKEGNSKP